MNLNKIVPGLVAVLFEIPHEGCAACADFGVISCCSTPLPIDIGRGIFEMARTEEEYQIKLWGMVEGGHDVDRAHIRVQLASASSFLWLQEF